MILSAGDYPTFGMQVEIACNATSSVYPAGCSNWRDAASAKTGDKRSAAKEAVGHVAELNAVTPRRQPGLPAHPFRRDAA